MSDVIHIIEIIIETAVGVIIAQENDHCCVTVVALLISFLLY